MPPSVAMTDVERLLRSALVPVDPPGTLGARLEDTLSELTDAAAGELAEWELGAMRDPRNWARPASAALVGGLAAGALIVVRARRQHRGRQARGLTALHRSVDQVTGDVRRRLGR